MRRAPCCLWRGATRIKCSQKSNSKPAGSSLKSFSPPQPPPWWTGAATTSLARLDSSCFVLPSKVTQATKSRWAPGPVESSGVGCLVSSTALDIGWFGGNLGLVLRSTDPNKAMIRRHQGVPVCPFRLVLTQRPRYEPRIMCLTTYASFTGPRASLYVRVSPLFSPFM